MPTCSSADAWAALPAGTPWSFCVSHHLLGCLRPRRRKQAGAFSDEISTALTNWIGLLIGLVAIVMVWRDRRALADAIRARLARPEPPPEVVAS